MHCIRSAERRVRQRQISIIKPTSKSSHEKALLGCIIRTCRRDKRTNTLRSLTCSLPLSFHFTMFPACFVAAALRVPAEANSILSISFSLSGIKNNNKLGQTKRFQHRNDADRLTLSIWPRAWRALLNLENPFCAWFGDSLSLSFRSRVLSQY